MEDFEILFVDDDQTILSLVEEYLTTLDYRISVVDNGFKALELIKDKQFDLVFTDFKMPEINGLELLAMIKEYSPSTEVIIVTGHGTMESAIRAMKYGSYDYIQKPFKLDVLKILIQKVYEEKKLKQGDVVLKTRLKERHRYSRLVGISLRMREIYEQIDRMRFDSSNVLIQGESGTGKELTAHVIHSTSARKQKPFIPVNCQSFGRGLDENQLRDHARTLFESSVSGTIFFDEIAELTPLAQAVLCRAYRNDKSPSGAGAGGSEAGVRLLAATNRNLVEALGRKVIEQNFLDRVNQVVIEMPPLRERKEDICLLINHFLSKFNRKNDHKVMSVSPDTLDLLLRYNWPGNVIQLENVIERAFALKVDLTIEVDDLPSEIKTFGEISKIS